jgi:hypothetical protein
MDQVKEKKNASQFFLPRLFAADCMWRAADRKETEDPFF